MHIKNFSSIKSITRSNEIFIKAKQKFYSTSTWWINDDLGSYASEISQGRYRYEQFLIITLYTIPTWHYRVGQLLQRDESGRHECSISGWRATRWSRCYQNPARGKVKELYIKIRMWWVIISRDFDNGVLHGKISNLSILIKILSCSFYCFITK